MSLEGRPPPGLTRYLATTQLDDDGTVSIQGPTGHRVIVPPQQPAAAGNDDAVLPAERVHLLDPDRRAGDHDLDEYARGLYRPLLGGWIVLGPQPKRFILTSFGFTLILALLTVQSGDIEKYCGQSVLFLGFTLHAFAFISFIIICGSDPGVIPENYHLSDLIWETEEYRRLNPHSRFYRYCPHCQGYRPPRSKHCLQCEICIRDHETHLLVGGTCIGQRNSRAFLLLSFSLGALTIWMTSVNSIILAKISNTDESTDFRRALTFISLCVGICLLGIPQIGIILFLFRIYVIGQGYTSSSYLSRKSHRDQPPLDKRLSCVHHYFDFFFGKKKQSVFRKSPLTAVTPSASGPGAISEARIREDWIALLKVLDHRHGMTLIEDVMLRQPERRWSLIATTIPGFPRSLLQGTSGEASIEDSALREHEELCQLAAIARPKTIPSDPQLQSLELDQLPFKKSIIRPAFPSMMQQKVQEVRKGHGQGRGSSASSRASPSSFLTHTLSQTAMSGHGQGQRMEEGRQEIQATARAQQLKRLIQLILAGDRPALLEMGRTVNIPGLLGVDHFDPSLWSFVELSNGLPMLMPVPRQRRTDVPIPLFNRRGLMGIPQMVAAGLLPPARELAQDLERSMGPGSVTRVPTHHNRFIYQSSRPSALTSSRSSSSRPLRLPATMLQALQRGRESRERERLIRHPRSQSVPPPQRRRSRRTQPNPNPEDSGGMIPAVGIDAQNNNLIQSQGPSTSSRPRPDNNNNNDTDTVEVIDTSDATD